MTFEETMVLAAHQADKALMEVMRDYARGLLTDEDDINGAIVGALRIAMSGHIGGLNWNASVARHRAGTAAEESRIGADILIHVSLKTTTEEYSKGVLIQAKRFDAGQLMSSARKSELNDQCQKMLEITPASYVFNYTHSAVRCGSAPRIKGSTRRDLDTICNWTSYRFFRELFMCFVGDERISGALVKDLEVPRVIYIEGRGEFSPSKSSGSPKTSK